MRVNSCLLFVALVFVCTSLNAEEDVLPSSSVTLEAGKDSADGNEAYLDLDLGFKNGLHLRGMVGRNKQEFNTEVFETRSRLIGVSSDYGAPFVAGFDFEYWGNAETLETHTKRFKLGANTDNWYVQLIYEDRTTRLYTNGTYTGPFGRVYNLPDYVEIDSSGTGLNISNYSFYPWAVTISYIKYSYNSFANNRDVSELAGNQNATIFFSLPTLGMATGLESWRRSGDIGYNFDWGTIGVSGSQSESAVDESIASTGSVYLIWEFSRDWSSTFTWGESGTDTTDETVRFGRVAVTHRW